MPHGVGELACPPGQPSPAPRRAAASPGPGALPQPAPSRGRALPCLPPSLPCPACSRGQGPAFPAGGGCHQYLQTCFYLLAPSLPADLPRSGGVSHAGEVVWGGSVAPRPLADAVCLPCPPSPRCWERESPPLHGVMCLLPSEQRRGVGWGWRGKPESCPAAAGRAGTPCNKVLIKAISVGRDGSAPPAGAGTGWAHSPSCAPGTPAPLPGRMRGAPPPRPGSAPAPGLCPPPPSSRCPPAPPPRPPPPPLHVPPSL